MGNAAMTEPPRMTPSITPPAYVSKRIEHDPRLRQRRLQADRHSHRTPLPLWPHTSGCYDRLGRGAEVVGDAERGAGCDGGTGVSVVQYAVRQDNIFVAKVDVSGPDENTARREAMHYLMMYGQDGPAELWRRSEHRRWRPLNIRAEPPR